MTTMTIPAAAKKSRPAATRSNGAPPKSALARVAQENSAEARSRRLLAAMVSYRDGDFSVRLPANWTGTDAQIAEAFNQTIGAVAMGDLGQSMELEVDGRGLKGEFLRISLTPSANAGFRPDL